MSEEEKNQDLQAPAGRAYGLIVDFDYTVVDGITLLQDVATKALSSAGATVLPVTFTRKLFGFKTVSAIKGLLGPASRTSTESVVSTIAGSMDQAIECAPMNAWVLDVCQKAMAEGVRVVFVTARSLALVEEKLGASGFADAPVIKVERCERFGEYAVDAWERAARVIGMSPRVCSVIAATAMSIRQAMMAGMRTVAVINPIISFQDFSGSDIIVEKSDVASASAKVLAWVIPEN